MNRRIIAYSALGCGTLFLLVFAVLAVQGYLLVHSYMPDRPATDVRTQATFDPHLPTDLFSREALASVMPPSPAASRLFKEFYQPNAYCFDSCPRLTRVYRASGDPQALCAQAVAIGSYYAELGYGPEPNELPNAHELPRTMQRCRDTLRKGNAFTETIQKDTGPKSRSRFGISIELSRNRISITTTTL